MQPWLWLVFSMKLAALWSSSALIQTPSSLLVQTNHTAKMSCEVKSISKLTSIYWLRERQDPKDKYFEFLASWSSSKGVLYGESVDKKRNIILESSDSRRPFLSIMNVKPEDSDFYFCATVGSPKMVFGTGTKLTVVDVLPTTAPTKKTTLKMKKKKQCPFPHPETQKGLTCSLTTLSLLVVCILLLLAFLGVAVYFYCVRRRARIHFMKQFHK
ncbi:T-cell surface glycoprotein CD8 beta chain precursor [Mus musculus]|uniref:T-cell surface glycoprotein CD8 beta chain n=4 Tax=Mus musculus TaxID=10090 RepID=CD8B_MOUSE|nr:T-cell surface glycoprotein CD8 beta chain precursor [Mus musculus]P10300.1 RecName: Full=T-cell surface glycoprotein CD8 beta chain; AltName: Full=Lymphocyte antigen 3; AltName: Full=T-cell membrane glycoprotein Ly-3; AltName: Full=T-cell surface glycoprotein Lyt-3; AltName: CD_antigen=CD8b; Flags: Precursor [Mus musculus]AAA39455.1 lymphocyte differentiation antigen [Mus musculus domesticus]AAA39454.1 lymphocyte differentiation antigen [Mus musculus]AAA39456.1 cD8 beta-chain [Mus musculus]|eukprot:NP_033988.1 T-cell surface glycoprotein CD8 beta chain precursor [Mus musculus]